VAGDAHPGAAQTIELVLFLAFVDAVAARVQAQQLVVEAAAALAVGHTDGAVVDAQKQAGGFRAAAARAVPAGVAFVRGEGQQFEAVPLRAVQLEGFDPSRRRVGGGQALGSR